MGHTAFAFFQGVVQGTGGTKCSDVTINPTEGATPITVTLSTTQTGGHIFYHLGNNYGAPTHTGDSATGTTVRIGGNYGTVNTGSGNKFLTALCYESGYLDSNVTSGTYEHDSGA